MREHNIQGPKGRCEIGLNDDGSVDEVVIWNPAGECVFHLEQMDNHWHWFAVYVDDSVEIRGQVRSLKGHIKCEVEIIKDADDQPISEKAP